MAHPERSAPNRNSLSRKGRLQPVRLAEARFGSAGKAAYGGEKAALGRLTPPTRPDHGSLLPHTAT
jgi:hypothetical protein